MIEQETVFMITGSASGIGAASAELVVELGGRVAVCDIDEPGCLALCKRLGDAALPVTLDVTDPDHWEHAADNVWKAFGGVDVLVNNAGRAIAGKCHELPLKDHREMIGVNLLGVINGIHAVVPRFLRQGSGHVVNVGSFAAFSPSAGLGCYCATKHGVRAFTHSCNMDLADSPVNLSLVCPSAVETPMVEQLARDDKAVVVFSEKPMPPRKVAEAIIRASVKKPHEILLPPGKGAFLRFFGLFPGLVRKTLPAGLKRGQTALNRRRQVIENNK